MASWMETVGSTVGRRWEELQKGETCVLHTACYLLRMLTRQIAHRFTRNQKRATLLLSDVSQSLRTALATPSPSAPSVSTSANPFAATLSPLLASPQPSLLDDDDDGAVSALGGVLLPDLSPAPSPMGPSPTPSAAEAPSALDDEDWNW